MDVSELLEDVKDSKSFLNFARALAADRSAFVMQEKGSPNSLFGSGANCWEATTIESFLESAIAWAEASDFGITQGLSLSNPWKQFAAFLYCGKIYE